MFGRLGAGERERGLSRIVFSSRRGSSPQRGRGMKKDEGSRDVIRTYPPNAVRAERSEGIARRAERAVRGATRMRENCTYGSMRGIRRKTAKHVLRVAEDRAGVPDNKGRSALLYTLLTTTALRRKRRRKGFLATIMTSTKCSVLVYSMLPSMTLHCLRKLSTSRAHSKSTNGFPRADYDRR